MSGYFNLCFERLMQNVLNKALKGFESSLKELVVDNQSNREENKNFESIKYKNAQYSLISWMNFVFWLDSTNLSQFWRLTYSQLLPLIAINAKNRKNQKYPSTMYIEFFSFNNLSHNIYPIFTTAHPYSKIFL